MTMQEEREKKSGRGGRRAGSGRPKGRNDVGTITLRIPEDVAKILEGKEHRAQYILEAIRAFDREERKHTVIGFEISYTKEDE